MKQLAVIAVAFLVSCSSGIKPPDPPKDLIGRDSMVVVLRELVVLEAYLQTSYQHVTNFHKVMTLSGKACLKKYHIRPDRFKRSFDYYVMRQEEMQSIYSEVLDSLNKEMLELGPMTHIDSLNLPNTNNLPADPQPFREP